MRAIPVDDRRIKVSTASLLSSLVARKKSSPLVGLGLVGLGSVSFLAGFAHAVALSVGDDDVGVV